MELKELFIISLLLLPYSIIFGMLGGNDRGRPRRPGAKQITKRPPRPHETTKINALLKTENKEVKA